MFSLPCLALWWEKLVLPVKTKALSCRGRDNVVPDPVITTPLLWLAFINLGGGFIKVGKLLVIQKALLSAKFFQ